MTGKIDSLNEKGFGFIIQEGVEGNVFFHKTALVDVAFEELKVGDAVSFDTEQAEKGPRAVNVKRA